MPTAQHVTSSVAAVGRLATGCQSARAELTVPQSKDRKHELGGKKHDGWHAGYKKKTVLVSDYNVMMY